MDTQQCTKCGRWKALVDFRVDSRRLNGHTAQCKACVNAEKRAGKPLPKPGGLVLVMPPRPPPPPEDDTPVPGPPAAAHYADQVAKFLGALNPPPGDADALLVHSLRHLATMADSLGLGSLNPVQELSTLTQRMIQVQRELAATRAAKAAAGSSPEVTRSKFDAFRDAK